MDWIGSGSRYYNVILMVVLVAQLVASRTNNRKVVGSIPADAVFHSSQVTAWGKLSAVAGHHSFLAVRSWSLRLSSLMDSDLA